MTSLANQWVLITGASSGLGRSMAVEFAKAGANLILSARNGERLEQLRGEVLPHGGKCCLEVGDLTQPEVIESLVARGLEHQIDILVNNAGIVIIKPLDEMSPERIDYHLRLNLTVPIHLTRAFLPMFRSRKSGTFVNVGSAGSKKPVLHHTVYCATKYGLNGFTDTLRLETKGQGIRILNVHPGKMATELFANAGLDWDTTEFIPPEDVAAALIAMLRLSPRSSPSDISIDRMS